MIKLNIKLFAIARNILLALLLHITVQLARLFESLELFDQFFLFELC